MKNLLLVITFSLLLFSCNKNPNKEARIQKLEAEVQQRIDKIDKLEARVETLEGINKTLTKRLKDLEVKR